VEDDTQPKMDSHLVITPLKQFFELEEDSDLIITPLEFIENESKFNEVQVTCYQKPDTKMTLQKINYKNGVTQKRL
jgi:hypothetical protein